MPENKHDKILKWAFVLTMVTVLAFFAGVIFLPDDDASAPALVARSAPPKPNCEAMYPRPTGADLKGMTAREAEERRSAREACIAERTGVPPPSPRGLWYVSREVSQMTGQNNVTADLRAEYDVPIRSYRRTRPKLVIRCHENVTSILVDFGAFITTESTALRIRIGDKKPQTAIWRMSTNYEVAGLWRGGEAIPFIKSLHGQKRLLVEVTPHSESTMLVEFDLTGIENAVAPVRATCSW